MELDIIAAANNPSLYFEIIKLLLQDQENQTFLLDKASKNGNEEIVRFLLESNSNYSQIDLDYALAKATSEDVNFNNFKVVKLLLDAGADPNHTVSAFPLSYPSVNGHFETVKVLVAAGADPNSQEALIAACDSGHFDIVEFLLSLDCIDINIKEGSPLRYASINGHFEIVKLLLVAGADVNVNRRILQLTPHFEIVKLLLFSGCDINLQEEHLKRPKNDKIRKLLLSHYRDAKQVEEINPKLVIPYNRIQNGLRKFQLVYLDRLWRPGGVLCKKGYRDLQLDFFKINPIVH